MTPLFIIGANLLLIGVGIVIYRRWIVRRLDPIATAYRLCGILMWFAVIFAIAIVVACFVSQTFRALLLIPVSLGIVTTMLLRRRDLARQAAELRKVADA
jgi:hypothetical protein